jgi:hypothetical protein
MEVLDKLTRREAQVYQCILEFGPISNEGIAQILGGHPHWYTGRIKTLRDELQVIEIAGTTRNEESNRPAALYKVKKWNSQLAFHF